MDSFDVRFIRLAKYRLICFNLIRLKPLLLKLLMSMMKVIKQ